MPDVEFDPFSDKESFFHVKEYSIPVKEYFFVDAEELFFLLRISLSFKGFFIGMELFSQLRNWFSWQGIIFLHRNNFSLQGIDFIDMELFSYQGMIFPTKEKLFLPRNDFS